MKTNPLVLAVVALTFAATAETTFGTYHPRMGRFIQRDPHGTAIAPPRMGTADLTQTGGFIPRDTPGVQYADGMNLYQYVRSNPIRLADPMGLMGLEVDDFVENDPFVHKMRNQCCGGKRRGDRPFLRCCGSEKDGKWYNPRTDCCEQEQVSTYKPFGSFASADGSSPIHWTEDRVVEKVSIWVCERPLAGAPWLAGYGGGLPYWLEPTHSYVCCDGPNHYCFGKQRNWNGVDKTTAGDPIPREQLAVGHCQEIKVCPALKRSKCINPTATYGYSLLWRNCHDWAWRGCE